MVETRKGSKPGSSSVKAPVAKKPKASPAVPAASTSSPVVVDSSSPSGSEATAPRRAPDASSPGQQQPAQVSYAQAANQPLKRSTVDASAFSRPPVVRGAPTFRVDNWESLERPAPRTVDNHVLYADLRHSPMTPHQALLAIHSAVGSDAVGVQVFAAQKVVSLSFAQEPLFNKHRNKAIADTSLVLYPALPDPVYLQKLTLQGCPTSDRVAVTAAIREKFKPYGEVVCVVPMEIEGTGWCTDTFHLTLQVPSADAALPPPQLDLFKDVTITVDAPGRRRFCKFCNSATHTRFDCRQGQRQRATQKANRQKEAAFLREQASDSSDDDTVLEEETPADGSLQQEATKEVVAPVRQTPEPVAPNPHIDPVDTPMIDVTSSNSGNAAYFQRNLTVSGPGNGTATQVIVGNRYAPLADSRQGLADSAYSE